MGFCYLGCKGTCVERCVKGDYEPTAPASYCDSEICQWARQTRGLPNSEFPAIATQIPMHESDARMPSKLFAKSSDFNRNANNVLPHIPEKQDTFGFFTHHRDADYFVGDHENLDVLDPKKYGSDDSQNGPTLVAVTEPKLDLSQIASGLSLAPGDIEAIISGKSTQE